MTAVVLDASAILAAILGEPGGDLVFDVLEEAMVGTVNIAEVYTYAALNALATDALDAFFQETGVEIVAYTLDQATGAGALAAVTRKAGLSLGDRSCLSLARLRRARVLTADRAWLGVSGDVGVPVDLLR